MKTGNMYRAKRASAAVELAVVLPILMMFLFGIIEMGRIFAVSHAISTAAREGARVAAMPGTSNSDVITAIQNELSSIGLSYDSITFTPSDISTVDPREPITVELGINYGSFGFVQGYFTSLGSMQIRNSVVMRKEGIG